MWITAKNTFCTPSICAIAQMHSQIGRQNESNRSSKVSPTDELSEQNRPIIAQKNFFRDWLWLSNFLLNLC